MYRAEKMALQFLLVCFVFLCPVYCGPVCNTVRKCSGFVPYEQFTLSRNTINAYIVDAPHVIFSCNNYRISTTSSSSSTGIYIAAANVTIKNCYLDGFSPGIFVANNATEAKILSNTIADASASDPQGQIYAVVIYANNSRLHNNTISSFRTTNNNIAASIFMAGVLIQGCTNVSVISNKFTNLQVEGYVSSCSVYGVFLYYASQCTVQGNIISGLNIVEKYFSMGNTRYAGCIGVRNSNENNVQENTCGPLAPLNSFGFGISVDNSENNTIVRNTITSILSGTFTTTFGFYAFGIIVGYFSPSINVSISENSISNITGGLALLTTGSSVGIAVIASSSLVSITNNDVSEILIGGYGAKSIGILLGAVPGQVYGNNIQSTETPVDFTYSEAVCADVLTAGSEFCYPPNIGCCGSTCSVASSSIVCRQGVSSCDLPEMCNGIDVNCPPDLFANSSATCSGECNTTLYCSGNSSLCDSECPPTVRQGGNNGNGNGNNGNGNGNNGNGNGNNANGKMNGLGIGIGIGGITIGIGNAGSATDSSSTTSTSSTTNGITATVDTATTAATAATVDTAATIDTATAATVATAATAATVDTATVTTAATVDTATIGATVDTSTVTTTATVDTATIGASVDTATITAATVDTATVTTAATVDTATIGATVDTSTITTAATVDTATITTAATVTTAAAADSTTITTAATVDTATITTAATVATVDTATLTTAATVATVDTATLTTAAIVATVDTATITTGAIVATIDTATITTAAIDTVTATISTTSTSASTSPNDPSSTSSTSSISSTSSTSNSSTTDATSFGTTSNSSTTSLSTSTSGTGVPALTSSTSTATSFTSSTSEDSTTTSSSNTTSSTSSSASSSPLSSTSQNPNIPVDISSSSTGQITTTTTTGAATTPSPTPSPTLTPTLTPTSAPTLTPTPTPTTSPTTTPTPTPTPPFNHTTTSVSTPTELPTTMPTATPTKAPCGANGVQYICDDTKECVQSLSSCPGRKTCPYYQCANGTCVDRFSLCQTNKSCSCWDGSCNEKCPTLPSCPTLTARAIPGGNCDSGNTSICTPLVSVCAEPMQVCYDGSCSLNCPAANGCPPQRPVMCPNGNCTCDYSSCLGECAPNEILCYDGSCATKCAEPPRLVQPLPFTVAVTDQTKDLSLVVPWEAVPDVSIVNIYIPSGTFSFTPPLETRRAASEVKVSVTPIPDSVLQAVSPRFDWEEPFFEINVFSQVINFSLSGISHQILNRYINFTYNTTLPADVDISTLCFARISLNNSWECVAPVTRANGALSASANMFAPFAIISAPTYRHAPTSKPPTIPLPTSSFNVVYIVTIAALVGLFIFAMAIGYEWDRRDANIKDKFSHFSSHLFSMDFSTSYGGQPNYETPLTRQTSLWRLPYVVGFWEQVMRSHSWLSVFYSRGHTPARIAILFFTLQSQLMTITLATDGLPNLVCSTAAYLILGAVVSIVVFPFTVIASFAFRFNPRYHVFGLLGILALSLGFCSSSIYYGISIPESKTEMLFISFALAIATDIFWNQPIRVIGVLLCSKRKQRVNL